MLKNPYYVYGPTDTEVPGDLHLGGYILKRLMASKESSIINAHTEEFITYEQIAQQAVNLAVSLTALGIRKGECVAICSENRMEYWTSVVGTVLTGAVLTTLNVAYTKAELTHLMDISKPKYVICSQAAFKAHEKNFKSMKCVKEIIVYGDKQKNAISFNDLIENDVNLEEFQPADVEGQNDLAFILYSSGTTGLPKGVGLTHLNCLNSFCVPTDKLVPFTDIVLTVNPWFHTMGLMSVLLIIVLGRTIVYLPKFDIDLYLRSIEKYKITLLHVVPPLLVAMAKTEIKYDMSSVKMVVSGAAPLRSDLTNEVQKLLPNALPIIQGYGMTECTLAVTRNVNYLESKPGCVGGPNYTAIIKILDVETRRPLGPNKEGEICIKGGIVMKGYVGKDSKDDFDEEGFFKTGDIGYYDDNRYFYIVDRLKELIKYKAYQVPPAEIEAVLLQHPAVRDAGVVGVPDAAAGEVPRAFVALQPGARASEHELQQFVAERLSNPKHLRGGVRFVPDVPKNPSGKILRRRLKEMLHDKSKL